VAQAILQHKQRKSANVDDNNPTDEKGHAKQHSDGRHQQQWDAVTGTVHEPGATWITPFVQSVQDVETRPRTYTMAQEVGEGKKQDADAVGVKTVNGSTVKVDITVRYRIKGEKAGEFVSEWNGENQMEKRLIRPTVRTQLRDEASDLQTTGPGSIYTSEGRTALESTAISALRTEFADQPVVLEAVQIRNIDLPEDIDATLDEKEQAKQQVQVEQEVIKQERAQAQQKRIQAEADADVIRIKGKALKENDVVLKDRYIEALRNGETIYVVPDDGGTPVMLQADKGGKTTVSGQ